MLSKQGTVVEAAESEGDRGSLPDRRAGRGAVTMAEPPDWPRSCRPVLPARWDSDEQRAHVPLLLVREAGDVVSAGACVVTDSYGRPGPAAKEGKLLRGTGSVTEPRSFAFDLKEQPPGAEPTSVPVHRTARDPDQWACAPESLGRRTASASR